MESSEEGILKGFIGAIRPPNLENAGVEDCALPPESIIEAFSIAASSLKSRVFSSFAGSAAGDVDGEEGGCVQNPGQINGQILEKVLGSGEISPPVQSLCGGVEEAAEHEGCNDDAIVFGDGGDRKNGTDKIVIVGGTGGEGDGRGFGL